MTQLDFFQKPALVSRWRGDGPYSWKDSGCSCPNPGDHNARWFDGTGWCQAEIRWCDQCQVWHPLDYNFGAGTKSIAAYRHTVGGVQ